MKRQRQNKLKTAVRLTVFITALTAVFTVNAFAAGEDIFTLGDKIIRDVYTHIAGISTVLAALMTAVAVITMKFSGTQQKSDQAWDWIKRIWIAWVIINGIGAFIAYITPLFDGYATLPGSTGSLPSGGGSAPAFIPDTGGSFSGGTGGGTAVSVSFLKYFT